MLFIYFQTVTITLQGGKVNAVSIPSNKSHIIMQL